MTLWDWFTGMTESKDALRYERDALRAELKELRTELRLLRAYVGEIEHVVAQRRLQFEQHLNKPAKELLKTVMAPGKPEPVKMPVTKHA